MSLSKESTEWHLTPKGYERGSETRDFGPDEIKPPPADRVATYRWVEEQSSTYSKAHRVHEEVLGQSRQRLRGEAEEKVWRTAESPLSSVLVVMPEWQSASISINDEFSDCLLVLKFPLIL